MKKIFYVIVPIVLAISFAIGFNFYLNKENMRMLTEKDIKPILHDPNSVIKNKGWAANNFFFNRGDILFMGSSELSNSTMQHPYYFFNTGKSPNYAITIGRAYTQSLQHAMMMGSLENKSPNKKKVVFLVSMQWFMYPNGVRKPHFQGRFSPTLFYHFIDNPRVRKINKYRMCKRICELLDDSKEYKPEYYYARNYVDQFEHNKESMVQQLLMNPYYWGRRLSVELKDEGLTYKQLSKLNKATVPYGQHGFYDWNVERSRAKIMATFRVGNNPYHVDKGYYKTYLQGKGGYFINRYNYIKLNKSKEYEDLDLYLDICDDMGVSPVVVGIPAMDKFYNFTGITRAERNAYYNRIRGMAKRHGFKYLDLRANERERYYLRDVMHLGTLGWEDVCEKVYHTFYKK